METSTLAENSSFSCLCNERGNYSVVFHASDRVVCRCNRCGQVYILGIDNETAEASYNDSSYFTERNCYLDKQTELSAYFQSVLGKIKRYKSAGRFLDIGCSVGILLDVARRNGFSVQGVEVSPWASDVARQKGFDVVTGGVIEAAYSEKTFDVIALNHVLEHIPEPVSVLQEVRRILKDDGMVVIGVPNFGSYMSRLMKEKWLSLMPDQHYWQFTRESLSNLLAMTGFAGFYFEARDNHEVIGWRPVKVLQRLVNRAALIMNNGEAMLVFARKTGNE